MSSRRSSRKVVNETTDDASKSPVTDRKKDWSITAKPFDITTDKAPGSYFKAKDGHMIYWNLWRNENVTPKAVVLAMHGVGEHIHRYDHVFNAFKDAGIVVKGLDCRGHGRTVYKNAPSKGAELAYMHMSKVWDDILMMERIEVEGCKGLPQFVFGHSMGGLTALSLVHYKHKEIKNFRGVISQAPALCSAIPPTPFFKFIVKMIKRIGLGRKFVISTLELLPELCSDDAVVAAYCDDPLTHRHMTFQLAHDLYSYADKMLSRSATSRFNHPLIMYFSTVDRLTNFDAGRRFFRDAVSQDKTLKEFPGAKHELHNEPTLKEGIIQDYINWILKRAM